MAATGRHGSRRLLVQALYQHLLADHGADELVQQFSEEKDFEKVDTHYFKELLGKILANTNSLDALIATQADRPVTQLDPVEHGILWLGLAELQHHPEVPLQVVINEAVRLAKEFGAQDGHRYINGLLDRLAVRIQAVA